MTTTKKALANRDVDTGSLSYRRLSTLLAALRTVEQQPHTLTGLPHFLDCKPLTPAEINELCEELNTSNAFTAFLDSISGRYQVRPIDGEELFMIWDTLNNEPHDVNTQYGDEQTANEAAAELNGSDPHAHRDAPNVCGECTATLVNIGAELYCVNQGCPMYSQTAAQKLERIPIYLFNGSEIRCGKHDHPRPCPKCREAFFKAYAAAQRAGVNLKIGKEIAEALSELYTLFESEDYLCDNYQPTEHPKPKLAGPLLTALIHLVNLTAHPMFPAVNDLPAWAEWITKARELTGAAPPLDTRKLYTIEVKHFGSITDTTALLTDEEAEQVHQRLGALQEEDKIDGYTCETIQPERPDNAEEVLHWLTEFDEED